MICIISAAYINPFWYSNCKPFLIFQSLVFGFKEKESGFPSIKYLWYACTVEVLVKSGRQLNSMAVAVKQFPNSCLYSR